MRNPNRTTLLINLSMEQAQQIRAAAKRQDRTISAYILRAVMNRINIEGQLESRKEGFFEKYVERNAVYPETPPTNSLSARKNRPARLKPPH